LLTGLEKSESITKSMTEKERRDEEGGKGGKNSKEKGNKVRKV
jgi:hypothetical protein